eukprot:CAMPEP_0182455020 /NCGR_PEP_ID=MMETSP1319-20130603/1376_1 /TAXON_ID=172717 /ORGANISM="Bolidomonas pacifica, Strain RCC208" /LENGTH=386 /DNA_ID=CAMNT_0024653049 /DNA_START=115 /DNA_END=1272 /DNA_ORIENTATION=+
MGFPEPQARQALESTGNIESAIALLCSSPPAPSPASPSPAPAPAPTVVDLASGDPPHTHTSATSTSASRSQEDKDLALAMKLSMEPSSQQPPSRSASINKAAAAALNRATTTTKTAKNPSKSMSSSSSSAPSSLSTRNLPASISSIPVQPRLLRLSHRLSKSSLAVATLLKTLTTIQQNPTTPKYRRVDLSSAGFKRSLSGVPGSRDFLECVGFAASAQDPNILTLGLVDPALFYAALECLKSVTGTWPYAIDLSRRKWSAAVARMSRPSASLDSSRARLLASLPSEPAGLGASRVTARVGGGLTLQRSFAADDVVADVVRWLGACLDPALVEGFRKGTVVLLLKSKNPKEEVGGEERREDVEAMTLKTVGMWPATEVEVVSGEVW